MANRNTILLKGRGIRKEAAVTSGQSVTPGHLVIRTSDGTVRPHNAAGGTCTAAFAVEDELHGKEITEAYAAGNNLVYEVMPPGAEVYALVAASAPAVAAGDFLESAGDGTVRKVATDAETSQGERRSVVAVAIEAVDNSSGSAVARIQIEVL